MRVHPVQSIQTLHALSHAIANFPIMYECGCFDTASWFVFKTLMHSCYFCMMHPGVILGLRGSMLNGMKTQSTLQIVLLLILHCCTGGHWVRSILLQHVLQLSSPWYNCVRQIWILRVLQDTLYEYENGKLYRLSY